jgi:putative aldouronate transport system permease protein
MGGVILLAKLKLKRVWPLHIMLLPAIVLVLIFAYGPMFGIVIAFQNYIPTRGFIGSQWVGLDHFKFLYYLPDTLNVIRNTLWISVLKIVFTLLFSIVVALLVNELRLHLVKRFVQSIVLFPFFLSWVILGGIVLDLMSKSGAVNQIMGWFNISSISFMTNSNWFVVVVVISHVWKDFGYFAVIIFAAIASINMSLYESAVVDGANRWKQTWHITLPGIRPIIVLLAVLSLGDVLNAGFDQIFNLYNSTVYSTGDIIDTFVYRMGILNAQYSLATAFGLFKSIVGFVLLVIAYRMAYKFANYRIF